MKLRLPFLLASALLSALATSHAANYTWSGSSNGGQWNIAANWNPAVIPGESASDEDQVLLENEKFGAASTLTLDSNRYLNSLSMTLSGRKSMSFDGTGELIFGGPDARLALNGEMTMSINNIVRHTSDLPSSAAARTSRLPRRFIPITTT